jgi:anti-anti-sigma regulatory factor
MFKVTTIDNQTQGVLVLEGTLVGPWLPVFKRTWDDARQAYEGARLVIDLTKVTVVSQHGENILFQMMTEGAQVVGKSFVARMVIQQLERRRTLQREERNAKSGRRASFAVFLVLLALAGQFSRASSPWQQVPWELFGD